MSTAKRKARDRNAVRPAPPVAGHIVSPLADIALSGGLSILVLGGYVIFALATGGVGEERLNLGDLIILQALINWPHFMASYRLLYSTGALRRRHPWAAYGVPAALLLLGAWAVLGAEQTVPGALLLREDVVYWTWLVAAFYLAWHYTGQAWGMVVSHAHLNGIHLTATERRLIRFGLRALLVWHVAWGAEDIPHLLGPLGPHVGTVQALVGGVVIASIAAGSFGFMLIRARTGRAVPFVVLVPWIATYVWYAALLVDPATFVIVQCAHALQYLPFPYRVEVNRRKATGGASTPVVVALYSAALFAVGLLVFALPDKLVDHGDPNYTITLLIASLVSIHHYFTDGVVWKVSNPEVRRDLFRHHQPAAA